MISIEDAVESIVVDADKALRGHSKIAHRWREWHLENPRAWEVIEAVTTHLLRNAQRLSMRAVFDTIRRQVPLTEFRDVDVDGFKLNNNHIPYCARLYLMLHPDAQAQLVLRRLGPKAQPFTTDDIEAEGDPI